MTGGPPDLVWYVMLFPSPWEDQQIAARLRGLIRRTGGEPVAAPHVTIGYFTGRVGEERIIEQLQPLSGPDVPIVADDLHSWTDEEHNLHGYTLSLKVPDTPELVHWQRLAHEAMRNLALTSLYPIDDPQRHLQVVQHLPTTPSETLRRLGDRHFALRFTATRLIVSYRHENQFIEVYQRPLALGTGPGP